MNYRDAKKEAEKFSCEDAKFDKKIFIKHHDGSTLNFTYSSYKKIEDEWILVATEHHGFFSYHVEDLDSVKVEDYHKYPKDDSEFVSEYVILANAASAGEESK